MPETWFISDPHYGHEKICTVFKRADGSPLRPFANAEEMNEEMVKRWNDRVRNGDKVYVLGDVCINRKFLPIVDRLKGSKRLIRGNHDIDKIKNYLKYFTEVYAIRVLDDMVLTHVPIHPDSLTQRFGTNVHGHLHANRVMWTRNVDAIIMDVIDPRYYCVCVEHTDYAPISLGELRERIQKQQKEAGYVPPKAWGNGTGPG